MNVWIARPLIRREVAPNGTYGIRTAATRADDRVWYDANEAGGRDLIVLAVVFAVCAVALPAGTDASMMTAMALVLTGYLSIAGFGSLRARRMLDARRAEADLMLDRVDDANVSDADADRRPSRSRTRA